MCNVGMLACLYRASWCSLSAMMDNAACKYYYYYCYYYYCYYYHYYYYYYYYLEMVSNFSENTNILKYEIKLKKEFEGMRLVSLDRLPRYHLLLLWRQLARRRRGCRSRGPRRKKKRKHSRTGVGAIRSRTGAGFCDLHCKKSILQ
jgi:hypothetical protein